MEDTMTTTDEPLTLRTLLLAGATSLSERLATSLEAGDDAEEIKAAITNAVPGIPLGPVIEGISKQLQQALDVPVWSILTAAWDRSRELRAAIRKTRDSTASVLVPLFAHTITSEHRPYVDVVVNDAPVARLVFLLKLSLQIDGVVLRVAGGRMTDVMSGTAKLKATLLFSDFVLLEKMLGPLGIPGSIALTPATAAA
jgi:hypothetical protein